MATLLTYYVWDGLLVGFANGALIHVSAKKHSHLGRSCFLEPDQENHMHGRGGFFIHGRGAHGSDGCIVPLEHFDFLLDQIEKDGGGEVNVFEAMDGSRFA